MRWHVNPVHGNALPFSDGELNRFDEAMRVSMVGLGDLTGVTSKYVVSDVVVHLGKDKPTLNQ